MPQTAAYYLVFIVIGMTTASFGPSLPGFARNTGSSLSALGYLFVFHRIGYITGSLGGGRVLDHYKGNRVTGLVLLVIALGLTSLSLATALPLLLGSILMLGLAQGTAEAGTNTGLVRLHGEKAGPYMNGLHLFFGVGSMAAPLILSASIGGTGSFRLAYWLLALIAALAGIWILGLPESGHSVKKTAVEVSRGSVPAIMLLAGMLFFTIAGEASFASWGYSYAVRRSLAGEAAASLLTSAFWSALTLGRLVGIELVRRLGPARLLLVNMPGAFLVTALFLVFQGNVTMLWLTALFLGFFQASIVPAIFTFAGSRNILNGSVAGTFIAASSLGGMVFPWLIGRFFDASRGSIFPVLLAFSQTAALLALVGMLLNDKRSLVERPKVVC